jgi:serine protease Do
MAVGSALDVERGMLDVRPGHPAKVTIRRGETETAMVLDVKTVSGTVAAGVEVAVSPDDQVWRALGIKTQPVSTEYVSSVSPKLRGGLYVQAVSPGSPAAQALIQKGDILVGINVGTRHWETIRADNILYVLRQPEAAQTGTALLYVVRRNAIQPRRVSLAESLVQSIQSQ